MAAHWATVIFERHKRVGTSENSLQDNKCPTRGSGWRHKRSISHLDLATSCHSIASGLGHWPNTRQLRHSRSLDYNHIDHCKATLDDIAEFYWQIDPDAEFYENENENATLSPVIAGDQKSSSNNHNDTHCRSHNYADDNYHSTEGTYSQQQQHQQHQHQQQQLQYQNSTSAPIFEYDGEACSLRRSRSLAVIREETFSDLQITSANSCRRRSQLIPRARLVNRGFLQEREKLLCNNNKHSHHHHHHHNNQLQYQQNEKNIFDTSNEQDIPNTCNRCGSVNGNCNGSATICDSHRQHHHQHHQNQHKHQRACGIRHNCHSDSHHHQSCETVDYYDNLKRLDALSTCFGEREREREQLHPWHNDKSDLESLNSDYFKNSLHQSHDLNIEALEEAVNLLTNEKPRIYQSRRQPLRSHIVERFCNGKRYKTEFDSCPENSQSSVFPETTTSNSDDNQTDSPSLSEQEYDLTKIEEIFEKAQREGNNNNEDEDDEDENYELISLTTCTRSRLETTEDEEEHVYAISRKAKEYEENSKKIEDKQTNNSEIENESEINTDDTLKRSDNLEKLIAYDSVYLSSEEGSESTLIENSCESFNETCFAGAGVLDETSTLLHICIEDTIYEPPDFSEHKISNEPNYDSVTGDGDATSSIANEQNIEITCSKEKSASESTLPLHTQVLKVEKNNAGVTTTTTTTTTGVTSSVASKPKILSVVEKRKLKRFSTENPAQLNVESINSKYQSPQNRIHQCQNHHQNHSSVSSTNISPFAHLKRQATDSVYLPYLPRANLGDNQYHSLPDVNIGQSLKVSECIDAELRSSYNYNRCRCVDVDVDVDVNVNCQQQEEKITTTTETSQHNSNKKRKTRNDSVTSEEINNSIKRFGRAHQKARQLEYQQLLKDTNFASEKDKDKKNAKEQQTEESEVKKIDTKPINENTTSTSKPTFSSTKVQEATLEIKASSIENTNTIKADSILEQEQPKEAPGIEVANFSKEIFERAKEIRESGKLKRKQSSLPFADYATFRISKFDDKNEKTALNLNRFRIIVTDTQNNIIEEDSIDGNRGESTSEETDTVSKSVHNDETTKALENNNNNINPKRKSIFTISQNKFMIGNNSLRRVPSKSRRQTLQHSKPSSNSIVNPNSNQTTTQNQHDTCIKSKEHRVLGTHIYKARPIRVITTNESFRRRSTNDKMSRPQILHVVENKRKAELVIADVAIKNNAAAQQDETNRTENEYFKKVDAVRCYWSKLAKDDVSSTVEVGYDNRQRQKPENLINEFPRQPERRHFILGAHEERKTKNEEKLPTTTATPTNTTTTTTTTTTKRPSPDDFCSFMPSIEIVELEGDKKAAIVSAMQPKNNSENGTPSEEVDEPQFDHIRYKVLKSQQLLRNNLMPRTRKEAQFDGLIQYLQDYSFQELLSNNNVVIVEPVRTKVELPVERKIETTKRTSTSQAKTSTSNTVGTSKLASNGGGIRRHFFYQPVRVNRELYEEELPNPDTVRNVRKFFEEHILPTPGQGLLVQNCVDVDGDGDGDGEAATLQLPKKNDIKLRRDRKYRYLTIDTSYGHTLRQQQHPQHSQHQKPTQAQAGHARKWDTASLSSGISSGDLSSPCECNDADTTTTTTATHTHPNAHVRPVTEISSNDALTSVQSQEFKGVHVQDVVRQHNSQNKKRDTNFGIARTNMRPRSVVYRPSGDSSYYRDVYECHIEQQQHHHDHHYQKTHSKTNAPGSDNNQIESHNLCFDEEDIDDEMYDDENENELYDTHYVSNEVLQKIRECGSTVTYYGGRVLQSTEPIRVGSPIQQQTSAIGTLNRLRYIETCSVCQPAECPQKLELQNKFKPKHDTPKDVGGIKFKLVKSNSCSSRLELAGAGDDEYDPNDEESEVVKRMVSRFERCCQLKSTDEEVVTINNQAPLPLQENSKKVTVNNHINMPQVLSVDNGSELINSDNDTRKSEDIDLMGKSLKTCQPNSKKGIENKNESPKDDNDNKRNPNDATKKIIRNKNVDLAFTMAKQLQGKPDGTSKDAEMVSSTPYIRNEFDNNIKKRKENTEKTKTKTNMETETITTLATATTITTKGKGKGTSVVSRTTSNLSRCDDFETNVMLSPSSPLSSSSLSVDNNANKITTKTMSLGKFTEIASDDVRKMDSNQIKNKTKTKPTQIIVPVQIHCTSESISGSEALCLSTTSSTNSLIEKNVVRHYVANDKSLFERRRYDDIEFEEFEVYDPVKEAEKRIENDTRNGNIENVESCQQQQQHQHQQLQSRRHATTTSDGNGNIIKSKSPSASVSCVSDMSSLMYSETNDNFNCDSDDNNSANDCGKSGIYTSIDCKSKSETDCYDSLDDRI